MSTRSTAWLRSTDVQARVRRWIAVSPLIYLIHDLEELATVRAWVGANWQRLPQPIAEWLGGNTDLTHLYAVAIATIFVVMAAVAIAAASPRATPGLITLFALCVMMRFGNGLLHMGQAVYTRSYVPGLVSALVLVLPYSAWLMLNLRRTEMVRHEAMHVLFIAGLLLQLPLIATVLLLASLLTRI
jgi:hypothetical protein